MDLQAFFEFDNADMVAPVGLSFGMKSSGADVFVLEVIGDEDSPIRSNGRILAFNDEDSCRAALGLLESLLPQKVKTSHKYDFVCDFSSALELITKQDVDRDAIVLNCINTVLDLIGSGPFELPDEYAILNKLADHLTFRDELAGFDGARSKLRDALLWCAGNVVVDLRVIGSAEEFKALLPYLAVTTKRSAGNGSSSALTA